MELLKPLAEQLVEEIVAVNQAWKVARNLFDETSPLATSLRDLKLCKQLRLLHNYGPELAYLTLDREALGEPLYSLRLRRLVGNRQNAEHLPVRVAQEVLSPEELTRLVEAN